MLTKFCRAVESDKLRWTHWVIAGATALLPASVSAINESLTCIRLDLKNELSVGDLERSHLSAAGLVGLCLGSFLNAALGTAIGRRSIILAGVVPGAVLTGLQALARSFLELLIMRGFAGLGIGFAVAAAHVYIAECFPIEYRGRFALGINLGYNFFAGLMVIIYSFTDMRAFLALTALPATLAAAFFLFLPESPRYLASEGNYAGAADAVAWLTCGSISQDEFTVLNDNVENPQEDEKSAPDGTRESVPFWYFVYLLGVPWLCLAVASGGLRFLFPVYIHQSNEDQSLLLLACAGADFFGCFLATMVGDIADRRLMISGAMLFAGAASFAAIEGTTATKTANAALQQGAQAIPWVNMLALSCEIFPTAHRTSGAAALRGLELAGLVATQIAAGQLIEAGHMKGAVAGYAAVYVLGGGLGLALLSSAPETVLKPIVESPEK